MNQHVLVHPELALHVPKESLPVRTRTCTTCLFCRLREPSLTPSPITLEQCGGTAISSLHFNFTFSASGIICSVTERYSSGTVGGTILIDKVSVNAYNTCLHFSYPSNTQLPPSLPIPLPPPGLFLPASRGVVSPQPSIYFNNTAPAANTIPPLRPPFASESAPLPFSQPREEPPPTRPPPSPAPQERPPFDATIFNRVQKPSRYMQEADITSLITNEKSNRYLDIYCE